MGGPTRNRRLEEILLAVNAARDAQRKADELACVAWNMRMKVDGGPAQPSPSLRAATNAGFRFLRVRCSACRTPAYVDLASVRRRPATPIWAIEGALACDPCRGSGRRAPRATIEALTRERRLFAVRD
jgi:hypothetical protein